MLTLQEVESVAKNYRFKYDYNTKTHTLINSSTNQPLVDKEEIKKAQTCILLNHLICEGTTPSGGFSLAGVNNMFFGTDDISSRREMFFNSLVNDIIKIVENGQFDATQETFGTCKSPIDFFVSSYKNTNKHLQDCYNSVLDTIMRDKGIIVDDFQITSRTDLIGKSSFSCSTHKISNQYTNTAQQTNTSNKKIVSRKFVETLIEKYKQCEDDQNFEVRSNNEDGTMQRVVQVLDSSQPLTQIPNNFHKFMRMLISAQNLSITGERDFLKEIVMQDAVNQRLLQYKNDQTMQQKIDSLINQKQSKQEKLGHKETRGEIARRITNSCIEHNADQFKQLKYAIQNNKSLTFESSLEGDRFKRIAELYATTQGHFDMFKDTENSII